MAETQRHPVQMLARWHEDGRMEPLQFRVEDEEQMMQTISVSRITEVREISHVGAEALVFRCKGAVSGRERLFDLRYALRTHSWTVQMVHFYPK